MDRTRSRPLYGLLAVVAAYGMACGGADPCKKGTPGTVCLVAGTGELGFNRDGKPPEETDFFLITRARRGPNDGLLYLMDFNNWRVRQLGEDGLIHTIAGNGFHAAAYVDTPAVESPLDNPTDFDFTPDGRLVMVSFEDPRVIVIDEDGVLRLVAGMDDAGTVGNEGDGGPATEAQFIELQGIAVAPDGAIYVSDSRANRVRVIRDGMVFPVAGTGEAGWSGDGGSANEAALNYPTALALDTMGNLYVADSLNHAIRRISTEGVIETVAGTGEGGLSGDGGPATQAQLNEPNGVVVDGDGRLYIADRANFRIRRMSPDGTLETIAGTDEGYTGNGGPALEAQFGFLARLNFDGPSLLVADQSNGTVRRVFPPEPGTP